jgi:cystathionine beta-lyase family protein involved in aluminum resistance
MFLHSIALINQEKVLDAFHAVKATESDLLGTTGYGYDDFGSYNGIFCFKCSCINFF